MPQQILGPEAYIYKKDLGDVYRDIAAIKGARFSRETGEAKQAGLIESYTPEGGEAPELSSVYAQQEDQRRKQYAIDAYDKLFDTALDYAKETGDIDGANEILSQGYAEVPEMAQFLKTAPKITNIKGNHVYQEIVMTAEATDPKSGKTYAAGTPVAMVYDEYTDELLEIRPTGEELDVDKKAGAGGPEASRKLFKDAYDYGFKRLGFNRAKAETLIIEVDESGTGAADSLTEEQNAKLEEYVEHYIRISGGDEQWEFYKRAKKRPKRQSGGQIEPTGEKELLEAGLIAPKGTKTAPPGDTDEEWRKYLTER